MSSLCNRRARRHRQRLQGLASAVDTAGTAAVTTWREGRAPATPAADLTLLLTDKVHKEAGQKSDATEIGIVSAERIC